MGQKQSLEIIVAVSENGVIGYEGGMPWHLRADLQRFSQITRGGTVIMGRKTWESIIARNGKPLPGRTSIVLTRNKDYSVEDGIVAPSLETALWFAGGTKRAFVIGGASLFEEALPRAHVLHLTEVHIECFGDTFFPSFDWTKWKIAEETFVPKDEQNEFDSTYYRLVLG